MNKKFMGKFTIVVSLIAAMISPRCITAQDNPISLSVLEKITPSNLDSIVQLYELHLDGWQATAWSSDGNMFAVAIGNDIWLYDVEQPQSPSRILRGHKDPVWDIAFSPDSHYLVSGSGRLIADGHIPDNTIREWDIITGQQLLVLSQPTDDPLVNNVTFNAAGTQIISVNTDMNLLRFWDSKTGQLLSQENIDPPEGWSEIVSKRFSPDGSIYGLGTIQGWLKVWRLGPPIEEIPNLPDGADALTFSRDNRLMAVPEAWGAIIHNLDTAREVKTEDVGWMDVSALEFSPDNSFLVQAGYRETEADDTLHFWDSGTGKQLAVIKDNETYPIDLLAFNPNGKLFVSAIARSGELRFWGVPRNN